MQPPCWPRIAGIILGIFREIPIVHNLPFTPPVPAWAWLLLHWNWFGIGSLHCLFWAWLLVNPAPVQLCISFNAATLELVQDWQAPLPVPGMVAGKSCACTPMFTLELVRDRQPPLPVPSMVAARSELVQDWWPTLPVPGTVAGESCTHTSRSELAQDRWPTLPVPGTVANESCTHAPRSEMAQDWWPTLPVLDTIAGESYTHTRMHNLASYLLLHFGSDRQPPMPVLGTIAGKSCICTPIHKHGASAISMNAHSGLEFICNHEALFWRLSEFTSVGLQLQHWLAIEHIPGGLVVHNMGHYILM
ncbi:hypothetical protein B0H13DRAFT_1885692 [Mycena leptocephala]|nr:hypothetical protein B0H13DRAFT_1885692 [Mycena leptocephala]